MQPEVRFRKKALADLEKVPGLYGFRIEQQSLCGTPDFVAVLFGHMISIEFKSSKKAKVSDLQKFVLKRIAECGGTAIIATPEDWKDILNEIKELSFDLQQTIGETNHDSTFLSVN